MLATNAFRFELKAKADAPGRFAGRASVYAVVDSYNDVVRGALTRHLAENGSRRP